MIDPAYVDALLGHHILANMQLTLGSPSDDPKLSVEESVILGADKIDECHEDVANKKLMEINET